MPPNVSPPVSKLSACHWRNISDCFAATPPSTGLRRLLLLTCALPSLFRRLLSNGLVSVSLVTALPAGRTSLTALSSSLVVVTVAEQKDNYKLCTCSSFVFIPSTAARQSRVAILRFHRCAHSVSAC